MGIRDLFKKKKKSEYDDFSFAYDFLERADEYSFDYEKPKKNKPAWKKDDDNPYRFAKYLDTIEDVQRKKITTLTTKEKIIVGITVVLIIYLLLALKGLVPIF